MGDNLLHPLGDFISLIRVLPFFSSDEGLDVALEALREGRSKRYELDRCAEICRVKKSDATLSREPCMITFRVRTVVEF